MDDVISAVQGPMDVEFLPLTLVHKIHRNKQSSQVEIVPLPYYVREPSPESEQEVTGELELEPEPPPVVYAPPLQALREKKNWWDFFKPVFAYIPKSPEGPGERRLRPRVPRLVQHLKFYIGDEEKSKSSNDLGELWWTTLDILAGKDEKRRRRCIQAELDEWLAKIRSNFEERYEKYKRKNSKCKKRVEPEVFGEVVEFECTFNNPAIRSRLEMLMGSNVVRITDRKYMMKLQERIKEDHLENLKRRIHEREADEVEREKKLILSGKISLDEAPKELKNHPICRINELAKKILEEKRAKMKIVTRTDLYKTSIKRIKEAERAEIESDMEMEEEESETDESTSVVCIPDAEVGEDINKGFMFSKEEYDRLRYEAPLVKVLKEIDSVDEMYKLADQIVGTFKPGK